MGEIIEKIIEQLEGFSSKVEAEYRGYKIVAYKMNDVGGTIRIDLRRI